MHCTSSFLPHNSVSYRVAVTFYHFFAFSFKWISLICVTFANVFVFIIKYLLTKWVSVPHFLLQHFLWHFSFCASISFHHHLHSWLHIHYARNLQCTQKENFIFCHNNCPFQTLCLLVSILCVCAWEVTVRIKTEHLNSSHLYRFSVCCTWMYLLSNETRETSAFSLPTK